MIAEEYSTVVNKISATAFHTVRISLPDCEVLEQEMHFSAKLQLHEGDGEATDL